MRVKEPWELGTWWFSGNSSHWADTWMLEMLPEVGRRGASTLAFLFHLTSSLLPIIFNWPNFPRSQLARKLGKHRLHGASFSLPSNFLTEQSRAEQRRKGECQQSSDGTLPKLLSPAQTSSVILTFSCSSALECLKRNSYQPMPWYSPSKNGTHSA